MIRNIDKLRSEGTMVQGSWLNKEVLMIEETINGQQKSRVRSPTSQVSTTKNSNRKREQPCDSIFNIELSDIN